MNIPSFSLKRVGAPGFPGGIAKQFHEMRQKPAGSCLVQTEEKKEESRKSAAQGGVTADSVQNREMATHANC